MRYKTGGFAWIVLGLTIILTSSCIASNGAVGGSSAKTTISNTDSEEDDIVDASANDGGAQMPIDDYCAKLNAECLSECDGNTMCQLECPVCPLNAQSLATNLTTGDRLPANCPTSTVNCLNDCKSTECRIRCFRNCASSNDLGTGTHTIIIHHQYNNGTIPNANSVRSIESKFHSGQNVTTVIKFTNVVNNTNYIEVPVNITASEYTSRQVTNNSEHSPAIESSTGGVFGFGRTADGACCLAIRPKSCWASSNGLRCHHRRHRTCGQQCTSRTIHVHLKKRCHLHEPNGDCRNAIAYVPQAKPHNCVYINQWPFVSCTMAFERRFIEQNCHGCYDHYGVGFHRFHEDAEHHRMRCRGCYDDAFEYGPLYRRGPVLRPYYYHQPPCQITGRCGNADGAAIECGPFGCFGDEFVDPISGQRRSSQPHDIADSGKNSPTVGLSSRSNRTSSEITTVRSPTLTTSAFKDNPTDLSFNRCKIVSDDGAIHVRNCTEANVVANPYAASPAEQQPAGIGDDDLDDEQYPIDYKDEENEDVDDNGDEDQEGLAELERFTRSHAKSNRPNLIYDDLDGDVVAVSPLDHDRQHKVPRNNARKLMRPRRARRRFRIVYDDINGDDYE